VILALVDLLANYYQAGDLTQMEAIARSMLTAMPDDIVSLQFLGLALYQTGRIHDAYLAFKQVALQFGEARDEALQTTCEPAAAISYRAAISAETGLTQGWWQIAGLLNKFGFRRAAHRAFQAAIISQCPRTLCLKPPVS
jgi:hypothetical protein